VLAGVPAGVIHGDLFRDNVRFDGDSIVCALDWESARSVIGERRTTGDF
jgi:Ser/Thr protein kinase RdoA (MazF antagonist)